MEFTPGQVERLVGILILALLVVGCLVVLLPFLAPILWALIIALVSWPVFRRLEEHLKGRRTLAASIMVLLLITVLLVPLIALATSLADDAVSFVQRVRDFFSEGPPDARTVTVDGGVLRLSLDPAPVYVYPAD